MPTVLLQGRIAAEKEQYLRKNLDDTWEVLVWNPARDPVEAFAPLATRADAVVGGNIPTPTWPSVPQLKLFQIPWTGYNFTSPQRMPNGVPVCNCFGHEVPMAEYVLLAILEWQIGLRRMDARWRAGGWEGRMAAQGLLHREAMGSTLGIVGYGHIGEEVAKRAAAFAMRVIGVRRSPMPATPPLDWLGTLDDLDRLLAESDFVLLACDLNEQTRNLIDAERLAQMRPESVLINVARGGVVDEEALFDALNERRIGGAVLDVWYNYNEAEAPQVWPSNRPFQGLDNVLLSAHESAMTEQQIDRRWQFVADNLRRMATGEPLHNVVFTGTAVPA